MPRANWKVLVNYKLVVPPTKLLQKFSTFYSGVVEKQQSLIKQNTNLRTTRDLLLPKLISGQLDVEDLDIDVGEPLEELDEVTA